MEEGRKGKRKGYKRVKGWGIIGKEEERREVRKNRE